VRNSTTSRRNRRSSSNSDAVTANGSACRASSASCAAHQFRNVVSFTPNRRATAARDSSLDNANCTASRRDSSGYLDGRPIRDSFLRPHARIRCPPKRVNPKHAAANTIEFLHPTRIWRVAGTTSRVRDAAIRVFRPEFLGDPDRDTPYRLSIVGKIVADLWSGHSGQTGIPGRAST
jgi:hypothetical protein